MEDDHPERHRAKFSVAEDLQLRQLIGVYGVDSWGQVAALMRGRNPRQCRERWKHYLSGPVIHLPWSPEEDATLLLQVQAWGKRWTRIAAFMGTRTDIEVKARWFQKYGGFIPLAPARPVPAAFMPPMMVVRGADAGSQTNPGWKYELPSIALPPQVHDWFARAVSSEM